MQPGLVEAEGPGRIPAEIEGRGARAKVGLSTFRALQYPDYARFWFGQVIEGLGGWIASTGTLWLVYEKSDSTVALGLTGLIHAVPIISLAMFGGAVADRVDRRKLLILLESSKAITMLVLGLLTVTGLVELWHIYALVFLHTFLRAFANPARRAMLPALVPRSALYNAVALDSTLWHSVGVVGPGIGGLLIAYVDVSVCFLGAGSLTLGSIVLLVAIRANTRVSERPTRGVVASVVEGLGYTRRDEVILGLMLLTVTTAFFGRSYQSMLPVYARDILDVGPQGLGVLMMAPAVGTIIGAVGLASLPRLGSKSMAVIGSAMGSALLLMVFAFSTSLLPAALLLGVSGLVHSVSMVAGNTLLQIKVADEFRGRVMSLHMVSTQGIAHLGVLFIGVLAAAINTPEAVALGAALAVVGAGLVAVAFPAFRKFREDVSRA